MRGFLAGVSVGALVAVTGAAIWSLSTPLRGPISVPNLTPHPILAPRVEAIEPKDTPGADADLVEAPPVAPAPVAAGDTPQGAGLDTSASPAPEVATEAGTALDDAAAKPLSEPDAKVAPATEAPTSPRAPAEAVQAMTAPEQEATPEAETTAPAPPPVEEVQAPELSEPVAEEEAPQVAALSEEPSASRAPEVAPQIAPDALGTPAEEAVPPSLALPAPAPAPQVRVLGEGAAGQPESNRIADLPQADGSTDSAAPAVGTRVVPLTERDKNDPAQEVGATDAPLTPFERNAEPVQPESGLPLMSIVLIEDETSVGAEALAEFPYPLTFAIDPADPKAEARMRARRAAGFEVMILADLPREAAASDAETSLPVWFERIPDAIGLLEGIDTGVQGNRPLADQVTAIAADHGYGLVFQDNGLNTVQKMALRDGHPAGVVFRDFDGAGQDPRAIRRFLDQAAFRAGQEGAVIMLGRLKPDTISALLIWGLQDRANRVALVPVSTSLERLRDPLAQ